jgi:hypothetical protein
MGPGAEDADATFESPLGRGAYLRGSPPRGWHNRARDEGAQGDSQLAQQPRPSTRSALIVVGEEMVERAIEQQTRGARKEMKKEVRAKAKDIEKAIDEA